MATILGGLWLECYICENKSRELQAISRIDLKVSRFRSFAKAQPAEVRLRKTQAFFSAQNDRLIVCFVWRVCFGMSRAPSPTKNFKLFRRGELCSPAFMRDMRSFSGCRGRHPLQIWIQCKQLSERPGSRWVSLRLGHVRVLTVHRTVIHYAHAASLPTSLR